jgi:hypothetical protein
MYHSGLTQNLCTLKAHARKGSEPYDNPFWGFSYGMKIEERRKKERKKVVWHQLAATQFFLTWLSPGGHRGRKDLVLQQLLLALLVDPLICWQN